MSDPIEDPWICKSCLNPALLNDHIERGRRLVASIRDKQFDIQEARRQAEAFLRENVDIISTSSLAAIRLDIYQRLQQVTHEQLANKLELFIDLASQFAVHLAAVEGDVTNLFKPGH